MPTRMTSAADWTMFQRRKAGVQFPNEVQKATAPTPTASIPYGKALLIPPDVGRSRIRRTAGDYTNFVASRFAERTFLRQGTGAAGENSLNTGAVTQFRIRACNCSQMTLSDQVYTCKSCGGAKLRL